MDNKPILTITIIMTEDRFHRNFTDYHIFQLLLTTLANQSYFFLEMATFYDINRITLIILGSHIFNICYIHFTFDFHFVILTNGTTASLGDFGHFIGRFIIGTYIPS